MKKNSPLHTFQIINFTIYNNYLENKFPFNKLISKQNNIVIYMHIEFHILGNFLLSNLYY